MMSIQLTEPLLLLFAAGVILAAWKLLKKKAPEPFLLLIIWLVGPLVAVILAGSTVYDGFRQVLFLIPPIFICAGLALDSIFGRIRRTGLRAMILTFAVLPGVIAILSLHPYEYVYYNSLVGGVRGASRNFELDYWGTSYREAANYVNTIAPLDAKVVVYGPEQNFSPYARSDLEILAPEQARNIINQGKPTQNYAVILSRQNKTLSACSSAEIIKTIEREGGILAVIKQIPPGQTDCP